MPEINYLYFDIIGGLIQKDRLPQLSTLERMAQVNFWVQQKIQRPFQHE